MNLSGKQNFFSEFSGQFDNGADSNLLFSFYDAFPYDRISDGISSLIPFFTEFPYTQPVKLSNIKIDYCEYYNEFARHFILDKEKLQKCNPAMNIWASIGLGKHEMRHCQLLTWLFNPKGDHGQQDLFLKCFLQAINHPNIYSGTQLFSVTREDSVGEFGRLDISMGNSQFWVIIEVKIDANEQSDQIARYRNYLNKLALWRSIPEKNCKLIFLTPDGRSSQDISIDTICINWSTISEATGEFCKQCQNPMVSDIVKQYHNFINKF